MDFLKCLEIVATILIMVGVVYISIPKKKALWIMLFGQICWSIYAFEKQQYFFLIQSIFLFAMNIIGIYNWSKKGIK